MSIAKKITIEKLKPNEMEKLKALRESGLFDVDSGKIEINVNNSQIQNIIIHRQTYRRDKSML